MDTINEISQIILNKSKFKETHRIQSDNISLLERIAGKTLLDTPRKIEIAKFIFHITFEMRLQDSLTLSITGGTSAYWDSTGKYNYACLNTSTYSHTTILTCFLNTYDIQGERFKPLLEKLKSNSGEELAAIIFVEIQKIHSDWENIYRNCDKYENLTLNYVDPEEIQSVRNLVDSGLFTELINSIDFNDAIFSVDCFLNSYLIFYQKQKITLNFRKRHIPEVIINKYNRELDFKINISDELYFISTNNIYCIIGIDNRNKFIFKLLDKEEDINGFTFDFSGLEGDCEKRQSLRMMIEMSYGVASVHQQTKNMTPKEAMVFSLEWVVEGLNITLEGSNNNTTPQEHREDLEAIVNSEAYQDIDHISFSPKARAFITGFTESMRDDHLREDNLLPIANYLKENTDGNSDYISHDVLDLICPNTDSSNHSKLAYLISNIAKEYKKDNCDMERLYSDVKKLDDQGLALLTLKLKVENIDADEFDNEIMTYPFYEFQD